MVSIDISLPIKCFIVKSSQVPELFIFLELIKKRFILTLSRYGKRRY